MARNTDALLAVGEPGIGIHGLDPAPSQLQQIAHPRGHVLLGRKRDYFGRGGSGPHRHQLRGIQEMGVWGRRSGDQVAVGLH